MTISISITHDGVDVPPEASDTFLLSKADLLKDSAEGCLESYSPWSSKRPSIYPSP